MAHKKEIMGDIPNATKLFSKKLGKTDREAQLIIPTKVLEQFPIQNGYYERDFTACDAKDRQWEFILAIRQIGEYNKPFLRPPKWHEFVMAHRLSKDDADYGVVFYSDNNGRLQVRGLRKNQNSLFGQPVWEQV